MRVPLGWLREYVRFDASATQLARRLSISTLEVERVIEAGVPRAEGNAKHFVVGKVVSAEKHPNADRLQLCQVDVGNPDPQQIVCGAWNFGAGATVAVALPGSTVFSKDGEAFQLGEAKLRGEASRGMILAEDEVGLGSDHAGIMILEERHEPGTPLVDVLPIWEQVLDVTPTGNRVDLLSMVGIAREVAALFDGELTLPAIEEPAIVHPQWVEVTIDDFRACPRYIAKAYREAKVGPSPTWLRARLALAEMRSISNVVDVTNYVMHVYGSPLHAFDRAKLHEGGIAVRHARAGEEVRTLDGTLRRVDERDLLITDGAKPVALAAIMGGLDSEVGDETRDLLLEAANFEPIGVLKTSERHALRTAGSNRWEKGVDPHLAEPAAVMASRMIVDLAGAELVGSVDVQQGLPARPVVTLRPALTDRVIGLAVAPAEQRAILERLGFDVDDAWSITVPTWRARDVEREIDVVEEVARVVLDRVPRTMPRRRLVAGHLSRGQRLRRVVEDVLVGAGYTEAYTWSLVGSDPDDRALRLPEPMAAGEAVLRTTLVDGLVAAARVNVDAGARPIRLFELAHVYLPTGGGLPDERWRVGGIAEGGYEAARSAVETLHAALKIELVARRDEHPALHPGKAAACAAGWWGELHPRRLDGDWGLFELDVEQLTSAVPERILYEDVISFPANLQDIAVVVDEDVEAGALVAAIREVGGSEVRTARVFDVYVGDQVPTGKKSVAVHLAFQSPGRTITDDEASALRDTIVGALHERFGAELRS
ncbi:MAG: phenylalanine--tRNA ligase subunit beta [Gaiellales bacterium]